MKLLVGYPPRRIQRRSVAHGPAVVGFRHTGRLGEMEGRAIAAGRYGGCAVRCLAASWPTNEDAIPPQRRRFRTACKVLGRERLETLTIHHGRHTIISHALAGGRSLAEARDDAGHANVSITSAYLHVAVEDDGVGELFRF